MRDNPRQHPCQASCHYSMALRGCLGSGPLAPGASPWPVAALQPIENKESRVAQLGFSRGYLVGLNERQPELQGGDYKAALPTNAAGNHDCDSISSAGNEHEPARLTFQ